MPTLVGGGCFSDRTRVDQRLIEIYQDQEIKLQNRLKESKKEAGRLIIRDNGLEIDTDAQIEKVLLTWCWNG